MRNFFLAASLVVASAAGLALAMGTFSSEGVCSIECRGARPQGEWSNTYGPAEGVTRSACEQQARDAQVEGVQCTASFVAR
ncbi:MAG: hypothetical protein ABIJ09_07650 [Pseudomonadota bacterium]